MADQLIDDVIADLRRAWDPQVNIPAIGVKLLLDSHADRLGGRIKVAYEVDALIELKLQRSEILNSLRPVEAWLEKARPPPTPELPASERRAKYTPAQIEAKCERYRRNLLSGVVWSGSGSYRAYLEGTGGEETFIDPDDPLQVAEIDEQVDRYRERLGMVKA